MGAFNFQIPVTILNPLEIMLAKLIIIETKNSQQSIQQLQKRTTSTQQQKELHFFLFFCYLLHFADRNRLHIQIDRHILMKKRAVMDLEQYEQAPSDKDYNLDNVQEQEYEIRYYEKPQYSYRQYEDEESIESFVNQLSEKSNQANISITSEQVLVVEPPKKSLDEVSVQSVYSSDDEVVKVKQVRKKSHPIDADEKKVDVKCTVWDLLIERTKNARSKPVAHAKAEVKQQSPVFPKTSCIELQKSKADIICITID